MRALVLVLAVALLVPAMVMGADGGQPEDPGNQGSQGDAPGQSGQGKQQASNSTGGSGGSSGDQGNQDRPEAEADEGGTDNDASGDGDDAGGAADDEAQAGEQQDDAAHDAGAGDGDAQPNNRSENRNARADRGGQGSDAGTGTPEGPGDGNGTAADGGTSGSEDDGEGNATDEPSDGGDGQDTGETQETGAHADEPLTPHSVDDPPRDARNRSNATGPPDERPDNAAAGEGDDDRGPPDHAGGDRPNPTEDNDDEQRRRAPPQAARALAPGPITLGAVTATWTGANLENLTVAGTLLGDLLVPGDAEAYRVGPHNVRILTEGLRLDLRGGHRLAIVADLDSPGLRFDPAADADLGRGSGGLQLQAGAVRGSAHGPSLDLENGTLHARDHLVLVAGTASQAQGAQWTQAPANDTLPYRFQGRYLSFTLNQSGIHDLVVHGLPLGQVDLALDTTPTIDEEGARLEVRSGDVHLRVVDAPATRLSLLAADLLADLPNQTALPSGGVANVEANDTSVELRVRPPPSREPAEPGNLVPTEPLAGDRSGLQTRGPDRLQVQATHPGALHASYLARDGQGIDLGVELVRALLVEDVDGDGRAGIGEPALAQRVLDDGATVEEDDRIVSTFSLWSGNLTVVAELREDQVKVTYEVEELSPPPGTLFVLESRTVAPNGSAVLATDEGVVVRNGTTEARFVAAGPVAVDGEPAWARHSVLLEDDGQARVLVTYPAGDHVVHDPTVTVQSLPAVTQQLFSAGAWSVAVGAVAGLVVVGYGIHQRSQRRL